MIEHHAAIARLLARAARAARRRCSTRSGRRTSTGTARAGRATWPASDIPLAVADRAARRVRRGRAPRRRGRAAAIALARERSGQAVRPGAGDAALRTDAEPMLRRARRRRHLGRGDRRRARARRRASATTEFDAALDAIADFVDLKSPYTLGHSRRRRRPGRRGGTPARARRGRVAHAAPRRRSCTDFGRLGVSNAIWDKPGPLGAGRVGAGAHAPLPDRAHARSSRTRSRRSARSPCSIASASTARATRAACRAARSRALGAHPRRRRRLPGDARAAAAPSRARRPTRPRPSCAPRSAAGRLDGDAVEAVLGAAGHRRRAAPRGAGRADRARGRGAASCSPAACRTRRSRAGW